MSVSVAKPLPAGSVSVLESLYQHRLLSTRQVDVLHAPDASIRWTQRLLRTLATRDLVASVRHHGPAKLWYLTPAGGDAVQVLPTRTEMRRRIPTPEQAAGPLRAHTLAVNDVGVAFVQAARQRGDDCGPLSWKHEIAHPIGSTPGLRGGEQLVADALLSYLRTDHDGSVVLEQRFLELDRGTMPAHALADKLVRYHRLFRHPDPNGSSPLWRRHYSTFPGVMVVFTGRPTDSLVQRRQTTIAMSLGHPELTTGKGLQVSFGLLDELLAEGPFAPVFLTLKEPQQWVSWLGDAPTDDGDRGRVR